VKGSLTVLKALLATVLIDELMWLKAWFKYQYGCQQNDRLPINNRSFSTKEGVLRKSTHQQNIEITCSNALKSHTDHMPRLSSLNASLYHGEAWRPESRTVTGSNGKQVGILLFDFTRRLRIGMLSEEKG
jgi:hypothetical protein